MADIFTNVCGAHLLAPTEITVKHHLLSATSLTVRWVELMFLYKHILFSLLHFCHKNIWLSGLTVHSSA